MRRELVRLVGNSSFVFGCRISGAALTFLTQVLLARWMGAAELGVYVLAFSWCLLISTLSSVGYSEATIRFVGHYLAHTDHSRFHGYLRRGQQLTAVTGIACAGLALLLIMAFRGWIADDHILPLAIAMLCVPFYSYMRLYSSFAHAQSRFSLAYVPNAVLRPALLLGAVALASWAGFTLSAERAIGIHGALIVFVAVVQVAFFYRGPTLALLRNVPQYETMTWFRTSVPLLLITLFTQYFYEISIVLISPHLSPEEVGVFSVSYRTALLIAFGLFAVNAVMMPAASRLYSKGDIEGLQRLVTRTTLLKFGPSLCAVAVVVVFGREILSIFGAEFEAGYEAFVILSLAQLLISAVGPVDTLMRITGHQDQCLLTFGVSLVLSVLLNSVLVPPFGILGAAAAVFIVVAFWSIWLHCLVVRHLGIKPSVFAMAGALANR
jgi:O-antigen/teichoic acid export membrane protein